MCPRASAQRRQAGHGVSGCRALGVQGLVPAYWGGLGPDSAGTGLWYPGARENHLNIEA